MNQICIESCKQINKYNSFFQVNLTVFRTGRVRLQIEIVYTCSHPVINRALLHTTVMLKTSVYSLIPTRSISLKKRSIILLNALRYKYTFVCYYIRLAKHLTYCNLNWITKRIFGTLKISYLISRYHYSVIK